MANTRLRSSAALLLLSLALALAFAASEAARAPRARWNGSEFNRRKVAPEVPAPFNVVVSYHQQYDSAYNSGYFTDVAEMYCGHGFAIATPNASKGTDLEFIARNNVTEMYKSMYEAGEKFINTFPYYVVPESDTVWHEVGNKLVSGGLAVPYYIRWIYCDKMKQWKIDVHILAVGSQTSSQDVVEDPIVFAANVTGLDEAFSEAYAKGDFAGIASMYSQLPQLLPSNLDYGFVLTSEDIEDWYKLKLYNEKGFTRFDRKPVRLMQGHTDDLIHEIGLATLSTPSDSAQEQQTVSGMYYVRWANEEDQKTGAKAWKMNVDIMAIRSED